MTNKLLPLALFSGLLLLTGCSKNSSIDSRKTATSSQRVITPVAPQLTDQDIFGNELTLEISENDIQNAVEEAQGEFSLPLYSSVVLIKSGSRAPDMLMQQEMQKYYRISTFSGIPVEKKKRPAKSPEPVKQSRIDVDIEDDFSVDRNNVINANYMQATRYIAAKGRQKAIVVYWDQLESGKYDSTMKRIVWKKYSGEKLAGSYLRYLIRFALVDVATGEWATYSPVNLESLTVPIKTETAEEVTEQQIISLEQKTYQMVVGDLVKRYGREI
ncbi:hypothetical protein BH012_19670 [Salmonella enterica]|nr:hypothetical protein [Salmonella enterica]EAX6603515.1 hypothetical protein [Salmonella enterica]